MADEKLNNASGRNISQSDSERAKQRSLRPLLKLFVIFVIFVVVVFLFQSKSSINWIEDYEAGMELSRQKDKPVLLAFFKSNTRFCVLMTQNTYNNPDVIKYVESNFIPILIDVDKHPEIAKQYEVGYYPTHCIKYPDSSEILGSHYGYDVPESFIRKLKNINDKRN